MAQTQDHWHVGRHWAGHGIEDACPCGQAPCGLVDTAQVSPDCEQHPRERHKTMRQVHAPEQCAAWMAKLEEARRDVSDA